MGKYITDLLVLEAAAMVREEENEHFLQFVKRLNGTALDEQVHRINDEVSAAIDCTQCGNCCQKLIINVTHEEVNGLAAYLGKPIAETREQYIEESAAGNCFINAIPCHFLSDKKCTVYEGRFTECRDFPHLHKNGFKERFLGTLLHYGNCPIVYNVVEQLKEETGFKE